MVGGWIRNQFRSLGGFTPNLTSPHQTDPGITKQLVISWKSLIKLANIIYLKRCNVYLQNSVFNQKSEGIENFIVLKQNRSISVCLIRKPTEAIQ